MPTYRGTIPNYTAADSASALAKAIASFNQPAAQPANAVATAASSQQVLPGGSTANPGVSTYMTNGAPAPAGVIGYMPGGASISALGSASNVLPGGGNANSWQTYDPSKLPADVNTNPAYTGGNWKDDGSGNPVFVKGDIVSSSGNGVLPGGAPIAQDASVLPGGSSATSSPSQLMPGGAPVTQNASVLPGGQSMYAPSISNYLPGGAQYSASNALSTLPVGQSNATQNPFDANNSLFG